MSEQFPNKCCRCGMCCISYTCDIGQFVFGIDKTTLCPALVLTNREASCRLYLSTGVASDFGIGEGCCIKSTALIRGKSYDFASLRSDIKIAAVDFVLKHSNKLIRKVQ